jgi:signal transduction histidine kinase/ActR/RegA family two-component response regulator
MVRPGTTATRQCIAVSQMLWSALLIHLSGGRIETHFHVFGSLAFLAWYRDWRVLTTATVVVATDHWLRGMFWPQSVYGVLHAAGWRTLEHGAWVLFEDVFLLISIRQSHHDMMQLAVKQAELTTRNEELHGYTQQLERAQRTLTHQASELERQAVDLHEAQQKAEQANQLKSEFLANMSHEIRTPMAAIVGFAEILADQATTPQQLDAVGTIQHNGEYLLELLNDILDLSKIEAGEMKVEMFRCLPHQIVAEVASLMRVRATKKNLKMKVDFAGPLPEVIQTDPTALRQILINLVGNAVKFTESGEVSIVTRFVDDSISPKIIFEIVDTGIGMTEPQIGMLFRPFTQADASMSRKYGGTGLGLTISKRLAQMLGGDVSVESAPTQGSTFRVTIATGQLEGIRMLDRMREAAASQQRSKRRQSNVKLAGRVLLAEDGVYNQKFLTLFLTKAGAEVTVADNGQVAVDMALQATGEGRAFDVVLMDMQMPVLDGYAAATCLRDCGYTGTIIALTAHAMSDDREKCLAAGCNDYGSKPIERADLLELVAKYMPSSAEATPELVK